MGNMAGEPLPRVTVYNPALLKKEALIAQFIARRPLLDRLVGELRRSGKTEYQRHMIIGPRGSGKTTLLRRLRYAIEDDPELYFHWVPLVFPEEQYNISRLSDLWVNCLDALSDTLERGKSRCCCRKSQGSGALRSRRARGGHGERNRRAKMMDKLR